MSDTIEAVMMVDLMAASWVVLLATIEAVMMVAWKAATSVVGWVVH